MEYIKYLLVIILLTQFSTAQQIKPEDLDKELTTPININMDLAVHERYADLHAKYAQTLGELADDIVVKAQKELGGKFTFTLLETIVRFFYYTKTQPDMFDEVMEISKASGVKASTLVFFNYYYEADGKACSSIVGRDTNNQIIFGSNLDFVFFKNIKKLTYQGAFYKNNELLYKSNNIYGLIGNLRGTRPGKYTLAINQREAKGNLMRALFMKDGFETLYFIRHVLENAEDFDQAVKLIETSTLKSSAFYVIGGISQNQGCVVERDEDTVHNKYCLTDTVWYLVQTNYDRDQPDPASDCRRGPAEQKMDTLGQANFNQANLLKILSEDPSHVVGYNGKGGNEATITTIISTNGENKTFDMWLWDVDELPDPK